MQGHSAQREEEKKEEKEEQAGLAYQDTRARCPCALVGGMVVALCSGGNADNTAKGKRNLDQEYGTKRANGTECH